MSDNEELNREFRKLQQRAKRLILSDYYDYVKMSELQYSILEKLTNASTVNDINSYLWNSGAIQRVLDYIADKIKTARRGERG